MGVEDKFRAKLRSACEMTRKAPWIPITSELLVTERRFRRLRCRGPFGKDELEVSVSVVVGSAPKF